MALERRRMQRREEGEARRKYWVERFGDNQDPREAREEIVARQSRSRPGGPTTDSEPTSYNVHSTGISSHTHLTHTHYMNSMKLVIPLH